MPIFFSLNKITLSILQLYEFINSSISSVIFSMSVQNIVATWQTCRSEGCEFSLVSSFGSQREKYIYIYKTLLRYDVNENTRSSSLAVKRGRFCDSNVNVVTLKWRSCWRAARVQDSRGRAYLSVDYLLYIVGERALFPFQRYNPRTIGRMLLASIKEKCDIVRFTICCRYLENSTTLHKW